jgi:hypothetical protein
VTVQPNELWVVRMRPAREAKIVVQVLDTAITGAKLRVVTREEDGGAWYETAKVEWVERIGRAS